MVSRGRGGSRIFDLKCAGLDGAFFARRTLLEQKKLRKAGDGDAEEAV